MKAGLDAIVWTAPRSFASRLITSNLLRARHHPLELEAAVVRGIILVFAVTFAQQKSWPRFGFKCDLSDIVA
jgi:hypothetical protein